MGIIIFPSSVQQYIILIILQLFLSQSLPALLSGILSMYMGRYLYLYLPHVCFKHFLSTFVLFDILQVLSRALVLLFIFCRLRLVYRKSSGECTCTYTNLRRTISHVSVKKSSSKNILKSFMQSSRIFWTIIRMKVCKPEIFTHLFV